MPQIELPKIGEGWINEFGKEVGYVAFVEGTIVTFVSRTGMRAAVQFDRAQNPWRRAFAVPKHTTQCSRNGCSQRAFLIYDRPYVGSVEVVCPLHVPKGVRSNVFGGQAAQDVFEGQSCAKCGSDATEVLGELGLSDKRTMWNCQRCSTWWLHHIVRDMDAIRVENYNPRVPDGYAYLSHRSIPDPAALESRYTIYVKPSSHHSLKGPRAVTLFDHVLHDDFNL
jgi:hypothetical protein